MITPFNRAELPITYDLNRLSRVRSALAGAGADYACRFQNLAGAARGRRSAPGMNQEARAEYKLYVRRKGLDWARAAIQGV